MRCWPNKIKKSNIWKNRRRYY